MALQYCCLKLRGETTKEELERRLILVRQVVQVSSMLRLMVSASLCHMILSEGSQPGGVLWFGIVAPACCLH